MAIDRNAGDTVVARMPEEQHPSSDRSGLRKTGDLCLNKTNHLGLHLLVSAKAASLCLRLSRTAVGAEGHCWVKIEI